MNVDPHIIHYTVYIIDNYTGSCIDKVNVTETSFRRSTTYDYLCLMYCVTAWNSGGEGDMSVPLPGYLPHSKLTEAEKNLLFWQLYFSLELQLFTWFCGMMLE